MNIGREIIPVKQRPVRARKLMGNILAYIGIAVILTFFLFPLIWEGISSIKSPVEMKNPIPSIIFTPSLENWNYIVERGLFGNLKNTLIISLGSSVVTLMVASLAAYAFTNAEFRGRKGLALDILTLRMLPPAAVVVPIFLIMKTYHLFDTYLGLILIYITFNLPLACWLLIGYFKGIPREIGEAARVDGCSWFNVLWRIIFPLSTPGLTTTFIFCVLFSWSEYLFALVLTGRETQTLPVAAASVMTHFFIDWGGLASTSIFIMVVPIVLTLIVQKHMVRGLSLGALK